jgi:hypothetical protein
MRPWMIVLSSASAAIVVAAALAVPEISNAPQQQIGQALLPHSFALAVAALAVYALCTMLLTTATLVAGSLRVRDYLVRAAVDRTLTRRRWVTVLNANGFRQLGSRLAPVLVQSAGANERVVLQTRFDPDETRSEVARLYYICLARSHFFSALIVLAGVVGLGLAQDRGSLPFLVAAIPTASAILILVGLMLLAALGRIVVDVTVEPLIDTIAQLPSERIEVGLLRRAVELLEMACNAPAFENNRAPAASPQLAEGLMGLLEQGQNALLDAVDRLTANTQALEATVRSSIEIVASTAHTTAAPQQSIDGFSELRGAVEELTGVIQRLSTLAGETREAPLPVSPVGRSETPAPQLARELQSLLKEIESAR